jgi:Fe-S cluster assembly iron-binding protein IscA
MFQVSDGAAEYVGDAISTSGLPETIGIRLSMRRGEDQQAIRVSFASEPQADDEVVEHRGAKVFVASDLDPLLADRTLDVVDDGDGERLVIRAHESDPSNTRS